MIGLVVVSHSYALARAAIELALDMVPADARPPVLPAAGLEAGHFGTDATAIAAALAEADSGDGVLVLLDLGSAVMSAEMAVEFLDPDAAARVRITAAPLVEGLVAAVVTAASGADLDACEAEALRGLDPKVAHLGDRVAAAPVAKAAGEAVVFRTVVELTQGLHARPAAALVAALTGFDAAVEVVNLTDDPEVAVDARSPMGLLALGVERGHELEFRMTGPDAAAARDAVADLTARNFGERR